MRCGRHTPVRAQELLTLIDTTLEPFSLEEEDEEEDEQGDEGEDTGMVEGGDTTWAPDPTSAADDAAMAEG